MKQMKLVKSDLRRARRSRIFLRRRRRRGRREIAPPPEHLPHAVSDVHGRIGLIVAAEGDVGLDGLVQAGAGLAPAKLIADGLGAEAAEPFALEFGLHLSDVILCAVFP